MSEQTAKSSQEKPAATREPRWRRRKDDRPKEIMDAALELFLQKGYAATRLEDIAQKASVTKGTLFIYFANKEDLFNSLILEGIAQMHSFSEISRLDFRASASESILLVVHNWWKFLANNLYGKLPKLIITESENFPEIGQKYVNEVILPVRQMVTDIIKQGILTGDFQPVNAEMAARIILAPLYMLLIWRHSAGPYDKVPTDEIEYLNTTINLALNGLKVVPVAKSQ